MEQNRITMSIREYCNYCIQHETNVEAGYVNNPSDLGGETNHGITVDLANTPKYLKRLTNDFGWNGKMIDLTQEQAYEVYRWEFWDGMGLDKVAEQYSRTLARTMFRWGLKFGPKRPVEHLQRILNVMNNRGAYYDNIKPDGYIGRLTRDAMDGLIKRRGRDDALTVLVHMLNSCQLQWMMSISESRAEEENETFTWGWVTRCMREQYDYLGYYGIPKL